METISKCGAATTKTRRTFTPLVALCLEKALKKKAHSLVALAKVGDVNTRLTKRYLDDLKEAGQVHVADWALDTRGYPTIRLYSWGAGADAPCPTTSDAARMKARRAAAKAVAK